MDESAQAQAALADAVDAVYAVPQAAFVATRKEQVTRLRAAGLREVAQQVAALRRPTVAAAAVNALVRADDPAAAALAGLGARMRHAQSTLDVAALTALRHERDEVLDAWVSAARRHAGAGLTAAVEAEVRATAVAALADPAAEHVVTSGSLTRALSYSGFGEVDLSDAVARTSTGVVLTRLEGGLSRPAPAGEQGEADGDGNAGREDTVEADAAETVAADSLALERALDEAEKVVAAARAARRSAAELHERASAELTEARRRVALAEAELARAEGDHAATATALAAAEEELAGSRQERDAARAALEEAEDR